MNDEELGVSGSATADDEIEVRGLQAILGPTINVIVAPSRCWQMLDARPALSIWILILIGILVTGLAFANLPITLQASHLAVQQTMGARGGDLSAEELEDAFGTMDTFYRGFAGAAGIFVAILLAIFALLIWFGASVMGGSAKFSRSFALAAAAGVVHPGLAGVYTTLLLRLNPPEIRRMEDMWMLAPSAGIDLFFDRSDLPVWLVTLLARIDLFNIWWIVLIASGSVVMLRLSKGKGYAVAIFIWALSTAFAVGAAALGSMSGGMG